ncbi:hypothetical protein DBV15_01606 [Temnothorax longispinosus]|uniref:Uncharacterized protein n=1 Tax=Temnothorax longispinosus TaxID=300112 RepID=A0A4S2KTJ3_9HYME|nr:hypothetical protein DBV15_01606 [Temnothorax longispinosus]
MRRRHRRSSDLSSRGRGGQSFSLVSSKKYMNDSRRERSVQRLSIMPADIRSTTPIKEQETTITLSAGKDAGARAGFTARPHYRPPLMEERRTAQLSGKARKRFPDRSLDMGQTLEDPKKSTFPGVPLQQAPIRHSPRLSPEVGGGVFPFWGYWVNRATGIPVVKNFSCDKKK